MTHQDVVEQMAVERYLLGELAGESREHFEEHLFGCQECAADLKDGVLFLNAAQQELQMPQRVTAPVRSKHGLRLAWLWQPWVLAPALAACLLVIVYQSAILLPHAKSGVAEPQTASVLEPLVLANAGARGDSVAEIVAPHHGFYLLSVDVPPSPGASGYRCSLFSPAGLLVWRVDVSSQQAHDAVTIQVPTVTAQEGMNELLVQSVTSSQSIGDKVVDLARYRYKLRFAK
ncbi:anti-sigma factor family protein [Granulicella arctica]|uniref:Putative zinc-finger domain-containing protein n=1 Tax=Granulicella arctica TaxID=940613 RepID=A0A7Y9PDU6_9BACT|nr:zf-HC2 domain-containing protein [Granulicella arctica]NYF78049.1 hypothetical protein [Granulicella arctica]